MDKEDLISVLCELDGFGWRIGETVYNMREDYNTLKRDVKVFLDDSEEGRAIKERLKMVSKLIKEIREKANKIRKLLLTEDERKILEKHYKWEDLAELIGLKKGENAVVLIFDPPLVPRVKKIEGCGSIGFPYLRDILLKGLKKMVEKEGGKFTWNPQFDKHGRVKRIVIIGDLSEEQIKWLGTYASLEADNVGSICHIRRVTNE